MKAILILDNIDETEIAELRANVQLNLYGEDRGEYNNCSLKPMPQKNKYDVEQYATVDYETDVTLGHFLNKGWNDCIDEILGEIE